MNIQTSREGLVFSTVEKPVEEVRTNRGVFSINYFSPKDFPFEINFDAGLRV